MPTIEQPEDLNKSYCSLKVRHPLYKLVSYFLSRKTTLSTLRGGWNCQTYFRRQTAVQNQAQFVQ